ncbi:uncharacterized protein UMAG_15049 [Mycosarcoma maydis]|uniref:PUM-HD domain-containing protein n=1 Tax=Mycosarcoma maydis TaxID=5270 RepID=A0A0D1D1C7_MYCMD|nr:uncharacterized protein UMAG_15049 [Ustilago maydis 521]KIS72188.1 hypothetical protein UMAG_15049 [Ustilago maydis 521]|eukprot:XP_011386861.1 hypothetical protein UMAG_15049 [Ustilago maydis 521]
MVDRRASSFVQHRSPSLSHSTTLPPPGKRSVSGSANSGALASFTPNDDLVREPSDSSLSLAHALSGPSPAVQDQNLPVHSKPSPPAPHCYATAMSKLDQNALDAKDTASTAPIFTPSPLLPQDGSAWSIGRPGSLSWANDLGARPPLTELITDSATSSPNAVKRATANDSTAIANTSSSPSATVKDAAATAEESDKPSSVSPRSNKNTATTVSKRAPIRSTTLDPKHLAANRRLSGDSDNELPSGQVAGADQDATLTDGVSSLTIATDNIAASNSVPQQHGYHSPPAFMGPSHHAPHPTAAFAPPPFSPGEAFMQPSPYLAGSGARSPDGYRQGFASVANMMPGMAPIDMSGYESYRTTPDPYAPTMPGRAIFASPGSQGSTPQSPSFGPTPLGAPFNPAMRNGEALFYPGVVAGFGPPPTMGGGVGSGVRPGMAPAPGQYGFGPAQGGVDVRSSHLVQSPMMAPGMPMPMPMPMAVGVGMGMGAIMLPPTSSPINASAMSSGAPDSRSSPSISQSSAYASAPHRRIGSSGAEPFGPGASMSPPAAFGMSGQAGAFVPGQAAMHGMLAGVPMHASMIPWNARFHDHGRVATGPGSVMAPVAGYTPIDAHYARNGATFYSAAPFHAVGANGMVGGSSGGNINGGVAGGSRSALLEEFRSRHAKNRKFELADIRGSVVEFSGDQHGSRFIQEKLDCASAEERKAVFEEVLPHARQLMTDVFGNYVMQKMLEHGDDEQRERLGREMEGHVLSLSLGTYGCRVVQKALDHVSGAQREKFALELDRHLMECVRDQNANHVVQKVIERVDASKIGFIAQAFVGKVSVLASHCYSCRVLQRVLEHCSDVDVRPLLEELHADMLALMQHQYANYVVQWVLQRGHVHDRQRVIAKIKGCVLRLSTHKFASNVVEQALKIAARSDLHDLVQEILTPTPPLVAPAVRMMNDQYANYVLQRFLECATPHHRAALVQLLEPSLLLARRSIAPSTPSAVHAPKHLVAIERLIDSFNSHPDA